MTTTTITTTTVHGLTTDPVVEAAVLALAERWRAADQARCISMSYDITPYFLIDGYLPRARAVTRAAQVHYDKYPTISKGRDYLGNKAWADLHDVEKRLLIDAMAAAAEVLQRVC